MTSRIVFVILLAMFASNGLAGAAPEPSQEEFVQTLKALRDPVVGPGSELTQQGDYTGYRHALCRRWDRLVIQTRIPTAWREEAPAGVIRMMGSPCHTNPYSNPQV